ncbi:MAG TPA: thiamine phosphate synthase [Candidatus Baltobacteraceae bacterium]|nr:thiamine phosphate synthase [Candidatus Baltobacteraceae bacterium]
MATHETARVTRARRAARLHGIYAIVNENGGDPRAFVTAILAAGVRVVQYRAKDGIVAEHLRTIRELTRDAEALLIANDDWRAAIVFDCDGVHLGPDDHGFAQVPVVRAQLEDRLIGLSCGSVTEARAAQVAEVDYLGVGSVYATASKSDAGVPIGLDGLRAVAESTKLPVAAIGGITLEHLEDVRATGVAMAAVISAIANAPSPGDAARELVATWSQ